MSDSCNPMDWSPSGSSVHQISPARILEWLAICFSIRMYTRYTIKGLLRWLSGRRIHLQCRKRRFSPWVGNIPWRRAWQLTPVFLPGKSHGRGVWRPTDYGVAKSQTRLKQLSMQQQLNFKYFIEFEWTFGKIVSFNYQTLEADYDRIITNLQLFNLLPLILE